MKRHVIILLFTALFVNLKAQDISRVNANNVIEILKNMEKNSAQKKSKNDPTSHSVNLQVGNKNSLNARLIDDRLFTLQVGYNNEITYHDQQYDRESAKGNNMQIQLKGIANKADIRGSNSISNGMSIEVNGSRSIIQINNYK